MTGVAQSGPVILLGCGRLGSAILEGWMATGAVAAPDLIVLTPSEKPAAERARAAGAWVNPDGDVLAEARTLVLAVKPAMWRAALTPLLAHLHPDLVVVSVMAGVEAEGIEALSTRPVARVMPTTAVAQAKGVAALWAIAPSARERARSLFGAIADVVDLDAEALMDAATAVAGSAPAFIYAFTQALARQGEACGLSGQAALRLASGALRSAGAGADTGAGLDDLIGRIASPGGTTRAGLEAMAEEGGLDRAAEAAVKAAMHRAAQLNG